MGLKTIIALTILLLTFLLLLYFIINMDFNILSKVF